MTAHAASIRGNSWPDAGKGNREQNCKHSHALLLQNPRRISIAYRTAFAGLSSRRGAPPEFLRLSRFHTGVWAGEWLVVTRYPSWAAYGKAQDGLSKDPDFARLMANTASIAELSGRNITVGIDL
jgi:hypothetical protein